MSACSVCASSSVVVSCSTLFPFCTYLGTVQEVLLLYLPVVLPVLRQHAISRLAISIMHVAVSMLVCQWSSCRLRQHSGAAIDSDPQLGLVLLNCQTRSGQSCATKTDSSQLPVVCESTLECWLTLTTKKRVQRATKNEKRTETNSQIAWWWQRRRLSDNDCQTMHESWRKVHQLELTLALADNLATKQYQAWIAPFTIPLFQSMIFPNYLFTYV